MNSKQYTCTNDIYNMIPLNLFQRHGKHSIFQTGAKQWNTFSSCFTFTFYLHAIYCITKKPVFL